MGIGPDALDAMEIWVVASVLGLADSPAEDAPVSRATASASRNRGRAMLKARVRAAAEGRPPPQWGPPSAAESAEFSALLQFRGAVIGPDVGG